MFAASYGDFQKHETVDVVVQVLGRGRPDKPGFATDSHKSPVRALANEHKRAIASPILVNFTVG